MKETSFSNESELQKKKKEKGLRTENEVLRMWVCSTIYAEYGPTTAVPSQKMDVCNQVKLLSTFKYLASRLY